MLAPCPFCGGRATAIITTRDAEPLKRTYFEDYRVGCMRCNVYIKGSSLCKLIGYSPSPVKIRDDYPETVRKWNYYASA